MLDSALDQLLRHLYRISGGNVDAPITVEISPSTYEALGVTWDFLFNRYTSANLRIVDSSSISPGEVRFLQQELGGDPSSLQLEFYHG